jgi:hypothetical protein
VAQVFLDDAEWATTLRAIHTALRPGGHLAFESRNPDDRAWERKIPRIFGSYTSSRCALDVPSRYSHHTGSVAGVLGSSSTNRTQPCQPP